MRDPATEHIGLQSCFFRLALKVTQTNKTGYSVETRIRSYCFFAAVVIVRVLFPFHQLMVLEFIIIIVIIISIISIIITIIIIIIYFFFQGYLF